MSTTTTRPPRRQRWADPTYCPERPRVPTMERVDYYESRDRLALEIRKAREFWLRYWEQPGASESK